MASPTHSEKSRGVTLGLAVPFGVLGLHRFYVGKVGTGILMLLTGGGAGLWWIVDLVNVAAGGFRDRDGLRVARWGFDDEEPLALPPSLASEVDEELDAINEDLDEVTARLESAERRLGLRSEE